MIEFGKIQLDARMQAAHAILVVPPFARFDMPHFGVHLLQACANREDFRVAVIYAGMYLAREIGKRAYRAMFTLSEGAHPAMYGERVFARAAYDAPFLGRNTETLVGLHHEVNVGSSREVIDHAFLVRITQHAEDWVERMAEAIACLGAPIVGFSAMFEQTAAAVALLRRVKQRAPATLTLFGGANAFGEMADGIAALCPAIDYVFSGESERAFPAFLAGEGRRSRVIHGEPFLDLDSLPTPDYSDYYAQYRACLGEDPEAEKQFLLPYETSRGCWWGQKHHCTFCGEAVMRYREKSADRVISELGDLLEKHPSRNVFNVDDIMPLSYFKTLIPRLGKEIPGITMFYEQKANLTLAKVLALHSAGISIIQPGLEALSSSLLRRMDKGLLARQNIALLRYARAALMNLIWSLLCCLPGDGPDDYAGYPGLLPLLRHLEPPRFLARTRILRFSPYHKWPERHGIQDLRPAAGYADVLPEGFDASRLAFRFDGEFANVEKNAPALFDTIQKEVLAWQQAWEMLEGTLPMLSIRRIASDAYLVTDTRGLPGTLPAQIIPRTRAAAALVGCSLETAGALAMDMEWAIASRQAVQLDGWHVPLATAEPELLTEFEAEYRNNEEQAPPTETRIDVHTLISRARRA